MPIKKEYCYTVSWRCFRILPVIYKGTRITVNGTYATWRVRWGLWDFNFYSTTNLKEQENHD